MTIKAVLFDMDGVIFDTEQLYFARLIGILRDQGYEMDRPFFISTLGVPNRACKKLYFDRFGDDFPYEEVYRRMFSDVREYVKLHGMPQKSGAEACLRALKARGLKLVLATSCPRFAVEDYFRTLPALDALFDGKVCGDDVVNGKPDPEIFLKAAGLAGEAPQSCVGVEDSASGLRAIRAAGAWPVMIPDLLPYSETLKPFVDSVLNSLSELPPLIDKLNEL